VEGLQTIIKNIITDKVSSSFNEGSIRIFNGYYYIFIKNYGDKIVICSNWKFNIIGYFIFKKKYQEMIYFYNAIISEARKENIIVEEIVKN